MAASSLESLMLKIEHLLLEGYAARGGKAPHFAVAADDAVAGDYQRQRILGQCVADGAARTGSA